MCCSRQDGRSQSSSQTSDDIDSEVVGTATQSRFFVQVWCALYCFNCPLHQLVRIWILISSYCATQIGLKLPGSSTRRADEFGWPDVMLRPRPHSHDPVLDSCVSLITCMLRVRSEDCGASSLTTVSSARRAGNARIDVVAPGRRRVPTPPYGPACVHNIAPWYSVCMPSCCLVECDLLAAFQPAEREANHAEEMGRRVQLD